MADIKIRIQADSSSAIKELEKLSTSSDYTAQSLSKLGREVIRASSAGDKTDAAALSKAQNEYLNAIDRTAKAYELSGTAAAAYRKQIALLGREYQKMAASNPASPVTSALGERLGSAEANLSNVLKEEAAMQAESARAAAKNTAEISKQSFSMKDLVASYVSANAIMGMVRVAMTKVINVMREAAAAAAEAEETANLFNATFENIASSARSVASEISSSLGIATSSAQEALGIFGSLAQGYGQTQAASIDFAEEAVRTTLDLISFRNITGDVNTIMSEFSSGLVGNYENFRKWGIVITANEVNARLMQKGLSGLTGEALQFAKIQETLNLVQERSANAMGDMERTLDSTANVTRRVTEANKELLENMGRGINVVLNPLKRMWLDITETINKAQEAQRLFAQGSKDIKVYDIHGNTEDMKDFRHSVLNGGGTMNNLDLFNPNPGVFSYRVLDEEAYIKSLTETMYKFGASAEDIFAVLEEYMVQYSEELAAQINLAGEQIERERALEKAAEDRIASLEDSMSSAQNFFDALSGISGVMITQSAGGIVPDTGSAANTDSSLAFWQSRLSDGISAAINEAIASLDSAGWDSFVSPIESALGIADESEGLEGKLEAVRSLYEMVYNQLLADGHLNDDELAQLDSIAAIYGNINAELEGITAEKERQKELQDSIASMTQEAASYEKRYQTLKDRMELTAAMPGASAAVINNEVSRRSDLRDIEAMHTAALALASTSDEIEEINRTYATLQEKANLYYDTAKENLEAGGTPDAGSSSIQSILDSLYGDIGNLVAAIQNAVKGLGLDSLWSLLASYAKQLTIVQRTLSILTDSILPILEAFFEPLLPMLDIFGSILSDLIFTCLAPAFPVLKMVAQILTFVIGLVQIAVGFIKDSVQWLVGWIMRGIAWLVNGVISLINLIPGVNIKKMDTDKYVEWSETDVIGNVVDNWDDLMDALEEISDLNMEIADNTSQDDSEELSIYNELLSKGLLTASEYAAMVSKLTGENYDNVLTYGDGTYWTGSGGSTNISQDNISIVINGDGLDSHEIAEEVIRQLNERNRGGSALYA